ncbi:HIV Tat-specific factor 1 homolog [Gigantopelta aegis]|uniref:HIV Tat-specific factor 1 homolog n=1 Tax=Gigantopelta aegis TaxID=1735272 RepID=UPI001B88B9DD|nr:HIV Tat-specific factor 1 homolog [Gigantopelta aegis]XP_041354934.1 HIV Tat-specific factor 1 homolog [Gigantopelta aegis]
MSEDFEEQLRLEQEEKKKKQTGEGTYIDSDGTEFEWDAAKKAWFPKIDEDFIARYQMNYGTTPAESSTKTTDQDEDAEASSSKEYEDYWRDYYNYYNHYEQAGSANVGKQEQSGAKTDKSGPEVDYTSDAYWEYYQYYYGEGNNEEGEEKTEEDDAVKEKEENKAEETKTEETAGEKRKAIDGWFEHDTEKSQHVYVSGLPSDITDDEYSEMMAKCGLIMYDPFNRKPKLKLYKDSNGKPKGDGLCCYIKSESVDLALQILDGSYIRDRMISVEKAKFEMKGSYDPKRKKKLNNRQKKKLKEKQEKLFAWLPEIPTEPTRKKHERTVILKHMFDSKEFDFNPAGIVELQDEVRTEALKFGEVNKVTIHDRNPDGVITLIFKNAEDADKCIAAFNGRWFAKRKISAETWDGKTKYHIEESEEERNKRLKQWETFLEKGEAAGTSKDSIVSSEEITSGSGRVSTTEVTEAAKMDDTEPSPGITDVVQNEVVHMNDTSRHISTTNATQVDSKASSLATATDDGGKTEDSSSGVSTTDDAAKIEDSSLPHRNPSSVIEPDSVAKTDSSSENNLCSKIDSKVEHNMSDSSGS